MEVEQPGSGWNHPKSEASEEREGRRVGNWQYEWLDPAGCRVSRAPMGVPPFSGVALPRQHPSTSSSFPPSLPLFTLQARHRLVHLRFRREKLGEAGIKLKKRFFRFVEGNGQDTYLEIASIRLAIDECCPLANAPCNIHHGTASLPGGRRVWDIGGGKEGVEEERVAMLLVLPAATGKWPQGTLLGTSRRSVAGPEGFWDSIKLDNAIMPAEQPSSFCHGRYVKNSPAGESAGRENWLGPEYAPRANIRQ
ncbi:hypothetical protein V1478_007184 [Vespula squamosa]|uniref:Uncharacterized protein n=1 Tax=Vespula squamosa TaxID=30214 RepID=A0ABD2B2K1_VESSQ